MDTILQEMFKIIEIDKAIKKRESQIKQKMDFKIREIKKKSQQMVQKKDKKRKFCLMF